MLALNAAESAKADSAAAAAFERDMQPVCKAVVAALQAGDAHALKGLQALLPHLLEEVNASPDLADVLAHQMGKALLHGFTGGKPEESQWVLSGQYDL
jgi:phage gp29-like protein